MTAVGVDVSLRRGLDIVVVDGDWPRLEVSDVIARATHDTLHDVLRSVAPAAVAIDGPPAFGVPPARTRPAELGLRALGVVAYSTPSDPGDNPFYGWMHEAIEAFAAASAASYAVYPGSGPVDGTALEVFPHGAAVALRGCLPPRGAAKKPWRLAALAALGVGTESLRTLDAVDACLAAVTAGAAVAGDFFVVGDATGNVVLPGTRPDGRYGRCGVSG